MKIKALLLMLVLMFISTNAFSHLFINGKISGDVQAGINVNLYRVSCGDDVLVNTSTTNSEGDYIFECVAKGTYRVAPDNDSYIFNPEFDTVQIPQAVIQSYDFSATATNISGCRIVDMDLANLLLIEGLERYCNGYGYKINDVIPEGISFQLYIWGVEMCFDLYGVMSESVCKTMNNEGPFFTLLWEEE